MTWAQAGHGSLNWRTALSCNGGGCVMVAADGNRVLIGDTKNPGGPVLSYTAEEWLDFLGGAKNGDFDGLV